MKSAGSSRPSATVVLAIAFGAGSLIGCSRVDPGPAPGGKSADVATTSAEDPGARALDFLVEPKPVKSLTVEALKNKLKPLHLEVFEPYEHANLVFTASPLEGVLDEAYGPAWRTHEAILLGCRDGYEPTIPVRRVLEHRAFLAADRPGDVGFTILKDEGGTRRGIELSPFCVIWENLDNARVRTEGDYGWPFQVVRIDLVAFRSRSQEMAPPANSDPKVLAGFDAFIARGRGPVGRFALSMNRKKRESPMRTKASGMSEAAAPVSGPIPEGRIDLLQRLAVHHRFHYGQEVEGEAQLYGAHILQALRSLLADHYG